MEPYFTINQNAANVNDKRYHPAINQITTEICYTKINAIYEWHEEGFSPFHAKVLTLDFLIQNADDRSLWKSCPNLYSQEIFDIITEVVAADIFPYNPLILHNFKQKYNLTTECEFIDTVVYGTQRFHDFMGYESNGLKSRQQYEGYEVVTKEFLAQNLNQRILVAGVKGSCRVKTYDKYRYMYMPKYYKTRGFIFKMTELVKSIK
ncbi:hypothetical protein NXX53_06635 [Bacteroides salyersiae]|uniref:hypothetical protein n=1 Tax=Bacteroides sp. TaxID=29523 RepID=UPI0025BC9CD9|nr:hypothetical protein [Bacteroides sp.]MCS2956953.1 hypothetical protein [Bacteroides salyersiae]